MLVAASLGHNADSASNQYDLAQELRRRTLIKHSTTFQVFSWLDRAAFLPAESRASAFEDRPVPIGSGAVISAPSSHARLLDLAADFVSERAETQLWTEANGMRVLDVGSGSGYLTAGLALVCHASGVNTTAVGVDVHPALVSASRASIRAAGIDMMSRAALVGDMIRGEWAQRLLSPGPGLRMIAADALSPTELIQQEPFDLIVCGGAADAPPPALLALLRRGGRMVLALGDGPVQRLALVDKRHVKKGDTDEEGSLVDRRPATEGDTGGERSLVDIRPATKGDTGGEGSATDVNTSGEGWVNGLRITLLESAAYARLTSGGDAGVGHAASGPGETDLDLATVQAELQQWQARFKESQGRRPSRADMQGDARAASLLAAFRQLSWDMKSQK
jgi:protein-L-isoaspartate(D-aspartate) O-methyltransferase